MALVIPQAQALDGRLHASDDDANVSVWPYTNNGEYRLNQSGKNAVSRTITSAPDATTNGTVDVIWNGVCYYLPFNVAVTCPNLVWQILQTTGSNYTIV